MRNLRHFYYQNKQKIWKVVLIIAFLLGIIYYINKQVALKNSKINSISNTNNNLIYSNQKDKTYISNKSAISGSTVTEQDVKKINNTIGKFLQYCKNESFEEAYNMVSLDCKEKKYSTLEEFKDNYAKTKFNKNNIYEIKEWIGNTYRISIYKDPLITGKIENGERLVEYITIVKEDSENKLNLNRYIEKRIIRKEKEKDGVKITVMDKETYLDYEVYNFKIENLSNKTIRLDSYEDTNTIYLEDKNGIKYVAYSHEIFEDNLIIRPKRTFELSIKFSNSYSSNTSIDRIVFSDFISDYDKYEIEPENVEVSEFVIDL